MKEEVLFSQDKKPITDGDILQLLAELGIKKGDVLMVHSDLAALGRPPEHFLQKKDLFLSKILGLFKEAVGPEGTILMPTFTYSFMKSEMYDVDNTPSTAGVLTEFFRKQKNIIRTQNPNLSFAVWGKEKDFFINGLSHDSYGPDSVFGKMLKKKAKILLFGASFKGGTTFVHHIEYMFGVPYRYKKLTSGPIKLNGKMFYDTYEHSMRFQDKYVAIDAYRKAAGILRKKGILKESYLGNKMLELVDTEEYFKEGLKFLKKDPLIFLNDKFFSAKNSFFVPADAEKKVALIAKNIKKQDIGEDSYIHGLDKGEVRFVYHPTDKKEDGLNLAMFFYLAEFLKNMPIQLKWSYRFVFGRPDRNKAKFVVNFPDNNFKGKSTADSLNLYLDHIYEIENNAVLYSGKKGEALFSRWLKNHNKRLKSMEIVFKLSNGQTSLSDISKKSGLHFKQIKAAADVLLREDFLKEIIYIK